MRRACLAAAVLVLGLGLAACGDDDSSGDVGGVPVYDTSTTAISVGTGEEFEIELESNPSTGYAWELTDGAGSVVTLLGSGTEAASGSLVGAPGVQRFRLEGASAGTTTLTFEYARSFEPDAPPAETATFDVTVT